MASKNLDLPHWVGGQNEPEIPSNSATDQQDLAENESITVTLPDADYDLVAADQQFAGDVIFDGVLTADRNVILMVGKQRRMSVTNLTSGGFSLIFKYAVAGDTVTVSNPSPKVLIQGDGTNVRRVADPDVMGYPEETIPQLLVDYIMMYRGADDSLVRVLLDNLPGGGGSGGGGGGGMGPLLHVRDEKANGINGGLPVADAWTARVLNTVKANEITGASLAANQVTLGAGTYLISAQAPGHQTGRHKVRWQNVTDAATVMEGPNAFTAPGASENTTTRAPLWAKFAIAAQKTFELQYMISDVDGGLDNGLGVAMGAVVPGALTEVYAEVMIWEVPSTGMMVVRQDLPTGTDGGPAVPGRNIRTLDNLLINTIAGASVSANVISLPSGAYEVRGKAPAFDADGHGLRVVDVSGPTDLITGPNEHSGAQKQNTANIDAGFFTTVPIDIRLEHYCESAKTPGGLGQAINEAGKIEVYAEMTIIKFA